MKKNNKRVLASATQLARQSSDILRDLDCETVQLNGEEISMIEASIRLLYSRSLRGDISASVDLQRIRDRCGAESAPRRTGCLVVPPPMSQEEWGRMAFEQQRQFREGPYPTGEL